MPAIKKHRFPAAAEDAYAAFEWALGLADSVGVGGDGAGGNLAAVTTLMARDRNAPLPGQKGWRCSLCRAWIRTAT